jgi:hypothetical protein
MPTTTGDMMGAGPMPREILPAQPAKHRAAERQQARVDAALQAGWVIRLDPVRGEYLAAREVHVTRTLDELLGKIESDGS